ncbi:MAG: beta-ketoacyl-ACP synthase II [Chrysiogenetes bacterium]|nr:beta-ketoacyl-ACP synthase II [Chrysiogenetes bacterium]
MTDQRKVVVTGMGAVTPLGNDLATTWKNLLAGKSGIGRITRFDPSELRSQIAGEVKDFNPELWMDKKEARKNDPFIQLAMAAAAQAMKQSGLEVSEELAPRAGCVVGSGIGGLSTIEENKDVVQEKGYGRLTPHFIPMLLINLAPGQISIRYNLQGPSWSPVSACATGAHSIGEATRIIQRGDADVMLAGGAEMATTPLGVGGFAAMRALSTRNDEPERASRPWDAGRDGFVMGEGAGVLVLEEYEHARARGAMIYAEVSGYGLSCDANHITAPTTEGPARAVRMALKDAGIDASKVGYVNAHGTSTPVGDVNETKAIRAVFGEAAGSIVVSSTKSMTGHLLGAAGAVEACFSIMALNEGKIPPTINLEDQDAECDLDYCANAARDKQLEHVMSNSFGFGGTNACLVLSKV